MIQVKVSVLIEQPIEEVFRFVATDFKGDGRSETPFEVMQHEPYHTFSWQALAQNEAHQANPLQISAQISYTFDPLPQGTRVTCEYQVSLGRGFKRKVVERLLIGSLRSQVQQNLAKLKELLEAPASAAPQEQWERQEELAPVFQGEESQEVPVQQVEQGLSRKPFPKKRLILVITGLVALLCSLSILHDYWVYQHYVHSSCVITAASVLRTSNKVASYQRSYEFTVTTAGGQTYVSHDSAGDYSTSDEAQAALPHYEVGSRYPCWYDPASPMHAALSHASVPFGLVLLYTLLAFAGYSLFIGVGLSMMVYAIVPALYLLLRGQRTTATVVDSFVEGRGRKVRVVRASYSIADRTEEITLKAGFLKIGQKFTLLFDPHGVFKIRPRSAAYAALFVATPLTLVLLATVLTLAYVLWFVVG
ncbi:MAG TPA: DUF3592 domain-containing protein [Ktedonobacteraceae bacterium]